MSNNIIYTGSIKDYRIPAKTRDLVEEMSCRECGRQIYAVFNQTTKVVTTYERDGFDTQMKEHEHRADAVTRINLLHGRAIEIRFTETPTREDYLRLKDNRRRLAIN